MSRIQRRLNELVSPIPEACADYFPLIKDIGIVTIYFTPTLPVDWWLKLIGKSASGFTYGREIWLRTNPKEDPSYWNLNPFDVGSVGLLFHELTHVLQFQKSRLPVWLAYLLNMSGLEAEAEQVQKTFSLRYSQTFLTQI